MRQEQELSKDSKEEQWKPVLNYEGLYEVSDRGNVRSIERTVIRSDGVLMKHKGRILRAAPKNEAGHTGVCLSKGCVTWACSVHTIVLEAFVGPAPNGMECCHGDSDPTNNNLWNLRWGTKVENERDKIANGTSPQGERHGRSKLTAGQVQEARILHKHGFQQNTIGRIFGVNPDTISKIILGNTWNHLPQPT